MNQGLMSDIARILILTELEKEPQHAYRLRETLKHKSGDLPYFARIYGLCWKYEEAGLLKSHIEVNQHNRCRRIYELTDKGKKTAQQIRIILSTLILPDVPDATFNTQPF